MKHVLGILLAAGLSGLLLHPAQAEGPPQDGRTSVPPWLHDRQPPQGEHPHLQRLMKKLEKKDPQDFEYLSRLRQDDPQAFRKELQSRIQKKGNQRRDGGPPHSRMGGHVRSEALKAQEKENWSLANKVQKAEGAERDELIAQLRDGLGKSFDERETLRNKQLDQLKMELQRHQEMADQRLQNRDKIIEQQLQFMLEKKKSRKQNVDRPAAGEGSPSKKK